jgi:hypothetical protein
MRRLSGLAAVTAGLLLTALVGAAPAVASTATASQRADTVAVTGDVTTPSTYTVAQLAALPQVTYPVTRPGRATPGTVTGVDLESLVDLSTPVLPSGKNTSLRVVLTVTGRFHPAVTFALGELAVATGS